jgi:hypothetical protein
MMWVRALDELSYFGQSLDIIRTMRSSHQFDPNLPIVAITGMDRNTKVLFVD